jgi:hypothetical protein
MDTNIIIAILLYIFSICYILKLMTKEVTTHLIAILLILVMYGLFGLYYLDRQFTKTNKINYKKSTFFFE